MEKINSFSQNNENAKQVEAVLSDRKIGEEQKVERILVGQTKDGANVYDRADYSHIHAEGGLTPELLSETLSKIDTGDKGFLVEQIDFDHVVGSQTCVDTTPEDEIVMVYRKGRNGQTPMVKNREMKPCNSVMAILKKILPVEDVRSFELVTGYVGEKSPREPWDPGLESDEERKECQDFWRSHALIYDDDLIDWERTKAFEFMSGPAKRAELIRQRTLYSGLFVDPEDLHQKIQPTLEKIIETPHVTANFKPDATRLYLDQLGSDAKIYAVGYGNDGKNEGLLVKVEAEAPVVQAAYDALEAPHITLSISKNGQAKDTAFLDFRPLDKPLEITGKYGLFSQGRVVTDEGDFDDLGISR